MPAAKSSPPLAGVLQKVDYVIAGKRKLRNLPCKYTNCSSLKPIPHNLNCSKKAVLYNKHFKQCWNVLYTGTGVPSKPCLKITSEGSVP